MSMPSKKALDAAHGTYKRTGKLWPTEEIVYAAHDPALGLDRSVCLRDVLEALRQRTFAAERSTWGQAADFIEREFGGES